MLPSSESEFLSIWAGRLVSGKEDRVLQKFYEK